MQREEWLSGKQTTTTRCLVARSRLMELLRHCELVPEGEQSAPPGTDVLVLEFHPPIEVQTDSFSSIAVIDLEETPTHDHSARRQLRVRSGGEFIETDESESYRRLVWPLGQDGVVTTNRTDDQRRIDFVVTGVTEPNTPREAHWTRKITVFTY